MYTCTSDIDSQSRSMGERNDCTVRAIAATTGLPYAQCHEALRRRGRRKGCGAFRNQWEGALNDLGFEMVDITREVKRAGGKTTRTVVNHLPSRPCIIHSSRHVAGWNGRQVLDWSDNRLTRVKQVWRVIKQGDTTPIRVPGYNHDVYRPMPRVPAPKPKPAPRRSRAANKRIDNLVATRLFTPCSIKGLAIEFDLTEKEARRSIDRLRRRGMDIQSRGRGVFVRGF